MLRRNNSLAGVPRLMLMTLALYLPTWMKVILVPLDIGPPIADVANQRILLEVYSLFLVSV